MARKWYARGLCFTCQPGCGRCCTNHDDYAQVYLEGDDLPRLAAHFELSDEAFRRHYTALDDGFVVLAAEAPDCPFLDGDRCTVYEARPTQCRTFPFWPEHLTSRGAWEAVAHFCPGIDRGERHPLAMIEQLAAERER